MALVPGAGTLLKIGNGDGPPETFTTIGNRISIEGPNAVVGIGDITTLDSTAKQKRGTILDPGDLTFTMFYDPKNTVAQQLTTILTTFPPPTHNYKLVFNNAGTGTASEWDIAGILKGFKPNGMEIEGTLGADVAIEVTGMPTIVNGT